jgi:hypothetical protein
MGGGLALSGSPEKEKSCEYIFRPTLFPKSVMGGFNSYSYPNSDLPF